MSNAILCFRTITRMFIGRQVLVSSVPTILPIAIASHPQEISINPGDKIEKVMTRRCDGTKTIDFTYPDESLPEIELKFGAGVMDLEALLHGKVIGTATTVSAMILAEFNSGALPSARPTGTIGQAVVAQVAATTTANAYYIDPESKLAKPIAIQDVSATLTGDQMSIGAGLVPAVSTTLAAKKVDIYAWVPCPIATATAMTAEPLGQVTIFAQGVNFDGTPRLLTARNCSRTESGPIASTPERTIKLTILPDVQSRSGLGWDFLDVPLKAAC